MRDKRFRNSDPNVQAPNYIALVWDSEKCNHMNQGDIVDLLNFQNEQINKLKKQNLLQQYQLKVQDRIITEYEKEKTDE